MSQELSLYINNLEGLIENIDEFINSILIKKKGVLLSMIKLRLFNTGVKGDGSKITPLYSQETIIEKKSKGQRTSHVTLRDVGDFYRSMFIVYQNRSLFVDSKLGYKQELITRYGKSILEFTDYEIENIILSIIEPEIVKKIQEQGKNIDFEL